MSDKEMFDTLLSNVVKIVSLVMKLVSVIKAEQARKDQEDFDKFMDILGKIDAAL